MKIGSNRDKRSSKTKSKNDSSYLLSTRDSRHRVCLPRTVLPEACSRNLAQTFRELFYHVEESRVLLIILLIMLLFLYNVFVKKNNHN